MKDDDEQLDWLKAELRAEKDNRLAPEGSKARVQAALSAQLALGLGLTQASSKGASAAAGSSLAWHGAVLTVGIALGALGAKVFWPTERVVYVPAPAVAAVASLQPVASASPLPSASASSSPAAAMPTTTSSASALGQDFTEERRMLDEGRVALAAGEYDRALAGAARHMKRFPRGLLAEERETLAIKALTRSGRIEAARTRYEAFVARFPASPQRAALAAELPSSSQK